MILELYIINHNFHIKQFEYELRVNPSLNKSKVKKFAFSSQIYFTVANKYWSDKM